ncbi:hypothetical protein ACHWQZ_G008951 [Mnemiopsis leidyi]
MEVNHTFLNSPWCFYFIDMTQQYIEDFISQLSANSCSMEALDCFLLEAIVRYDPTTYEGKSPKYEGIWDVLKQQALLVTFIRDLVLARGQLILAPRFLNFIEIVQTRKSAPDYKCTRQEECVLLTKSWDIYAMRGSHKFGSVTNTLLDLAYENCKDIDFTKVKSLISSALGAEQCGVPELISDKNFLKYFAEFISEELIVHRFDSYFRNSPKRENKLINTLLFLKGSVWKSLFGKEADKLERADDDEKTYLIIENEPLVNRYISVPKDKSSLNCAAFMGGIVEALLNHSGFPCKVTAHWHKGSTLLIKFEDSVMQRENAIKNM